MPTYEYHCLQCGERFERAQHVTEHDSGRVTCPKCGSDRIEQIFSRFYARTAKKS